MSDDTEYKYTEKVLGKYHCFICTDILSEPTLTDCCGQHFCKVCLEKWFTSEGKKICPHCRDSKFTHIIDKPTQREINDLPVYCPNQQLGCKETITRGSLDKHLKQCTHATVKCTNNCELIMFRKDLDDHLKEHCEQRQINCEHCGELGVYRKITTHHRLKCTHLPIECPNDCQQGGLIRKDLQVHLEECVRRQVECQYCKEKDTYEHITATHLETCLEIPIPCPRGCKEDDITRHTLNTHKLVCEMEFVQCPFAELGCKERILRKDLDDHSELNIQQHLVFMMRTGQGVSAQLKRENENLSRDVAALRQSLNELRLEHQKLRDEHKELRAEHYKLKAEHQELQVKL